MSLRWTGPSWFISVVIITILAVVAINLGGFFVGGSILHWWFYRRRVGQKDDWKYQPDKFQTRQEMTEKIPLVLLNGTIISATTGAFLHNAMFGETGAYWGISNGAEALGAVLTPILTGLWYHTTLYYWHRTLHHPKLFRHVHYLHHKYKTPMFLDALYEHPIEAMYGAMVIGLPLLAPVWLPGWFAWFGLMGAHELLDHAGAKIDLPFGFLSNSKAHDEHHRRFNGAYGQLLPLLDWLHDTPPGKRPKRWRFRWSEE